MAVAAHPRPVEAGGKVLRAGETEADAMIAVQAVLGLVQPQSSRLGGGAFLTWYDAGSGTVTTLDSRETAPLVSTPRLLQNDAGERLGLFDAVVGCRSVGTPGTPALLQAAHERWCTQPWASLFDDAVRLAEIGFEVSARLSTGSPDSPSILARLIQRFRPVQSGRTLAHCRTCEWSIAQLEPYPAMAALQTNEQGRLLVHRALKTFPAVGPWSWSIHVSPSRADGESALGR